MVTGMRRGHEQVHPFSLARAISTCLRARFRREMQSKGAFPVIIYAKSKIENSLNELSSLTTANCCLSPSASSVELF